MRYQTPAERAFEQKLELRLIGREERRKQAARDRWTRIKLGAPTPSDVAEITGTPRVGRLG
jgi:hypothetical protein